MSLKCEPSSEPLLISVKQLFLNSERFLSQEGEWGAVNDELRHIHVAADAQDALHSARLREVPITHLIVSRVLY